MGKSSKNKLAEEELTDKKRTRKIALRFILIISLVFLIVWFGAEFLAKESIIRETHLSFNGKARGLRLSEKSSAYRLKNSQTERESGITHYCYFLELIDTASQTSLHKLKFKSPVLRIQNKPQMIPYPNGTIWIVSTSSSSDTDSPGFILKFLVNEDKIVQEDFDLGDDYRVIDIMENRVILAKGRSNYRSRTELFNGIYLDLETGQIVNQRKETK